MFEPFLACVCGGIIEIAIFAILSVFWVICNLFSRKKRKRLGIHGRNTCSCSCHKIHKE